MNYERVFTRVYKIQLQQPGYDRIELPLCLTSTLR